MNHLRRRTLVILIVTVLASALIWYYFANVYDGNPSIRGTLVEQETERDLECVLYRPAILEERASAYGCNETDL